MLLLLNKTDAWQIQGQTCAKGLTGLISTDTNRQRHECRGRAVSVTSGSGDTQCFT